MEITDKTEYKTGAKKIIGGQWGFLIGLWNGQISDFKGSFWQHAWIPLNRGEMTESLTQGKRFTINWYDVISDWNKAL